MPSKPTQAYKKAQEATMNPREAEATVLTRAAQYLKNVQTNWESPNRDEELMFALKYCQRVWTFFQGTILNEDNPLPIEIRQNILNLSLFVDKRIFDAMAFPSKEKLEILIKINLNLASGLRGSP
jgi:flagellar protein FlaF